MFSVRRAIREYCHPTSVQQDRLGLLILRNARLLPSQNGLGKPHIIAVAHVDGDVRTPGMRSDDIHIAKAPLDDFYSEGLEGVDVIGVADQYSDLKFGLEFGVGTD